MTLYQFNTYLYLYTNLNPKWVGLEMEIIKFEPQLSAPG